MNRSAILSLSARWLVMIHLAIPAGTLFADAPDPDPVRFAKDIAEFERQDRDDPPPPDNIVFLGSSSIRGWPLSESFPGLPVVNRGFGGSQFSDALFFVERILRAHRPRAIVLYEGDNDIAAGKSPQQVAEDLRALITRIRQLAPAARIVVIAIKPSPARWQYFRGMQEANALMAAEVARWERVDWVDVVPSMLDRDGQPCRHLFGADCLHLNEQGYRLWTSLVRCAITADRDRPQEAQQ